MRVLKCFSRCEMRFYMLYRFNCESFAFENVCVMSCHGLKVMLQSPFGHLPLWRLLGLLEVRVQLEGSWPFFSGRTVADPSIFYLACEAWQYPAALPRLCSNGARSPEATNIWFRANEKNYPVAQPGTLACCISSR